MKHAKTIVCFGEMLWDCLPAGLFLGGAPLNVAYHLAQHGLNALPVSAVGRDFLGTEARRRVQAWGVDTRFIAQLREVPTGTVNASLDAAGVATFEIRRRVAWDRIPIPAELFREAPPSAIVFGTLALREPANRRALAKMLAAWPRALRVADLNFRVPFDTPRVIATALASAQLVKVNEHELARLVRVRRLKVAGLEKAARTFAREYELERVCVTAGEHGAGLLWDGAWHFCEARTVQVRDTIGAGDAFLGGLLAALLQRRESPAEALDRACRLAEFVAASDGATPPYECDAQGQITVAARR